MDRQTFDRMRCMIESETDKFRREIRDFADFISAIEELGPEGWAFRGQLSAKWTLDPSIRRYAVNVDPYDAERLVLERFQRRAHHFLSRFPAEISMSNGCRCCSIMERRQDYSTGHTRPISLFFSRSRTRPIRIQIQIQILILITTRRPYGRSITTGFGSRQNGALCRIYPATKFRLRSLWMTFSINEKSFGKSLCKDQTLSCSESIFGKNQCALPCNRVYFYVRATFRKLSSATYAPMTRKDISLNLLSRTGSGPRCWSGFAKHTT